MGRPSPEIERTDPPLEGAEEIVVGAISLGADAGAFATRSDSARTREEGERSLPWASPAAQKPVFVFEVWGNGRRRRRQLKPEEINPQGILAGGLRKDIAPPGHIICFPGPASPRSLVRNYYPFCCVAAFPPNVDSKGLAPSL